MHFDFTNERILAVVSHPDDADYLAAGTLARAKADGAAIGVCVLCRGDKGQPAQPIANLDEVRREEMTAAAELLGAELFMAGFGDGELFDGPEQRSTLIELIRRFRPTLLLAHSPNDYHADHRAAGAIAEATSWSCASGGQVTDSPRMEAPPALWWMDSIDMSSFEPGFFVDVTDYLDLKRRMLNCHKSQLARSTDGDFSPLEEQMIQQAHARGTQAGVRAAEAFRMHLAWKRARAW